MYTVKIYNEFLHGPIWVYNSEGIIIRKYPKIYEDTVLLQLNKEADKLYSECFEFDIDGEPCKFNYSKEKEVKPKMLEIIQSIIKRLSEINDNSFVIEDYETERLNNL